MNDETPMSEKTASAARLYLKARILLPLLAVIIILTTTITSRIYQIEYRQIRSEVVNLQKSAHPLYDFSIEKRSRELTGMLEAILRDRQLLEAFKSKKRHVILDQGVRYSSV